MTRRISICFEGETMVDVYAAIETELARVRGNLAPSSADHRASLVAPPPAAPVPSPGTVVQATCSGGHGAMRLIPGGTAKSGPRIGQPYPAFWKCDRCGERQELTP